MKFTILILTLVPTLAFADVNQDLAAIDATYSKCMDSAESNMAMKECTFGAYQDADKVLNASYQGYVKSLKAKTANAESDSYQAEVLRRMVVAERAWLPFRDAQCQLVGTDMLGGSGESLEIGGCLYDETVRRVKALAEVFAATTR